MEEQAFGSRPQWFRSGSDWNAAIFRETNFGTKSVLGR